MAYAKRKLTRPHISALEGETTPPEGEMDPELPRRQAAVTVLFSSRYDEATLLLIRRAAHRGNHRTEWAFPGGVSEPIDDSLKATALRETHEEIGVPRDGDRVLGTVAKGDHWNGF